MSIAKNLRPAFVVFLFAALASPALASEAIGKRCLHRVCFAAEKEIGGSRVTHLGSGRFRYLVFDVYTAALYGPPEWGASRAFRTDVPSELVLEYHRSITAEQFAESANDILAKQHGELPESVRADVARLHAAYRTVQAGDRYALRFEPGVGTSLFLNHEPLITIPGSAFADHYFGIWLDARRPLDEALREELFGAPGRGWK